MRQAFYQHTGPYCNLHRLYCRWHGSLATCRSAAAARWHCMPGLGRQVSPWSIPDRQQEPLHRFSLRDYTVKLQMPSSKLHTSEVKILLLDCDGNRVLVVFNNQKLQPSSKLHIIEVQILLLNYDGNAVIAVNNNQNQIVQMYLSNCTRYMLKYYYKIVLRIQGFSCHYYFELFTKYVNVIHRKASYIKKNNSICLKI